MVDGDIVIAKMNEERMQGPETRKNLYVQLEKELGRPVVSYFTSFSYPAMIEDADADMLEGILQKCCLDKGFALLISSPGGSGVSAERIINLCRSYSGTNEYEAIVPGKAKSAATIVCLGSSKICMGNSSELGAIDPQVMIEDKAFSVYNIIDSYNNLFGRAVESKGNLQPFLQQLSNYDEREIAEMKSFVAFSEDAAIKALQTGMMKGMSSKKIKSKINSFITPQQTKVHERPIYAKDALKHGLNVDVIDHHSTKWETIYELYVRLNSYVSHDNVSKCIECKEYSFRAMAHSD